MGSFETPEGWNCQYFLIGFTSFSSCQFVEGYTLGSLKTPFMQNPKYFCSCAIGLNDSTGSPWKSHFLSCSQRRYPLSLSSINLLYTAGGRFDHWFLSTFKCYNIEERLYTTVFDGGRTAHVNDMLKVLSFETLDQLFKTAGQVQKLHLSLDEINVLKAVAFFSRGKQHFTLSENLTGSHALSKQLVSTG